MFASFIECQRQRRRIIITGNPQNFRGTVFIRLLYIYQPLEAITTDSFFIKTYDGFNKKIIARSYANLDPFYFTFKYPGPIITINNDKPIYVARGTVSDKIKVTLDAPCLLNLTLQPVAMEFSVLPYEIELKVGQTEVEFQITVPQDIKAQKYTLSWDT